MNNQKFFAVVEMLEWLLVNLNLVDRTKLISVLNKKIEKRLDDSEDYLAAQEFVLKMDSIIRDRDGDHDDIPDLKKEFVLEKGLDVLAWDDLRNLCVLFSWKNSPQGLKYWHDVWQNHDLLAKKDKLWLKRQKALFGK